MNNFQELLDLYSQTNTQITFFQTLINFSICIALSFIVRAFYINRSFSLVGKTHIASIIPILSGVVFLVIMVVKSSLALSLGLVGALSIVRFRTPIKEPEELVYLFLSIALGLCLGTEQLWLALLLVAVVTVFAVVMRYFTKEKRSGRLLLTLTGSADQFEDLAGSLLLTLETSIANVVIQRFDLQEDEGQLRVVLGKADAAQEKSLLKTLQRDLPGYQISLVNLDVL